MNKILGFLKQHRLILLLFLVSCVIYAVNVRINYFKYNNFDFGKFDLGNMTQMVWNASQGRGLYLTDYFGTNLPRWAMSHVDPILFIFVPIFMLFPHPLTLVFSQLFLVVFSSLLVFLIAEMHLKNKLAAFLLGLAYLFNPSIGYLTAWSGFHGVTAVIPFFLGAFYYFELMYKKNSYRVKDLIIFSLLLILNMMGKEQIPLYVFLYGFFILIMRNGETNNIKDLFKTIQGKIALAVMLVSFLWFFMAFFVIIPANAHYRIEGYQRFAQSMGLEDSSARDVNLPNYFLNRYEEFGDSYLSILGNMIMDPEKSIRVFFSGDKIENFRRTFEPLAFLPFAYPVILLFAVPDLIINFMTTAGGIGTSEILNHRISMILPVLFLATIFGIRYISSLFKHERKIKIAIISMSILVLGFTVYTTHYYNNPVYLWVRGALEKRIVSKVFAKSDLDLIKQDLKIGDVVRISELDSTDRECALKIVDTIPDGVSVSGPDSLGAHLAQRETYAIFPALYQEADYVIVDVFSQKILRILDLNMEITGDVVKDMIKSYEYELETGCGNYFVFKRVGYHEKGQVLPMQERFEFEEKMLLEFFQGLAIVDYTLPSQFTVGKRDFINIVYHRMDADLDEKDSSLSSYLTFISFVNADTGEIYQMANLPAFALKSADEWVKSRYYLEELEVTMPKFVDSGTYHFFVGMGNKIRTRSIYLGDVEVTNP